MPHVFISYVRENGAEIQRLADALRAYGVDVWMGKDQIKPGLRWEDAIRGAIGEGAFFIACFSRASNERMRTYMNEEITVAIEELRQRPTDQAWFIPVLLDDTDIPSRNIGAGETLRSLQWVRLNENWSDGIARILSVVRPDGAELHRLAESLADPSARVRIQALDRLANLGSLAKPLHLQLMTLLHDENDTVRAVAVDAVRRLGIRSGDIVGQLRAILKEGEYYSSRHAAKALAQLGLAGVPALLEATTSKAYGVSHLVSRALAEIRAPDAVPLLIEALKDALRGRADCSVERDKKLGEIHSGPHIAQHICEALGEIRDPSAVQALKTAETSRCRWTAKSASEALARIRDSRIA
jgi:HEAT repeat protein